MAAHERRHAQMQEANEQLLLAALDAQDLQAAAERAQQRQDSFRLGKLLDHAASATSGHGIIRLDAVVHGASAVLSVTDDSARDLAVGIYPPVVRLLVTALGSTVVAESASHGHGSRFVVTLPLADANEPPPTRLASNV